MTRLSQWKWSLLNWPRLWIQQAHVTGRLTPTKLKWGMCARPWTMNSCIPFSLFAGRSRGVWRDCRETRNKPIMEHNLTMGLSRWAIIAIVCNSVVGILILILFVILYKACKVPSRQEKVPVLIEPEQERTNEHKYLLTAAWWRLKQSWNKRTSWTLWVSSSLASLLINSIQQLLLFDCAMRWSSRGASWVAVRPTTTDVLNPLICTVHRRHRPSVSLYALL